MNSSIGSLLLAISLWLSLTLICCTPSNFSNSYEAKYQVTGDGTASITYSNQDGGTEQQEISLPWEKSFKVHNGDFLYISAQKHSGYSSISAVILVNGTIRKTATSQGEHSIATSSYSCCY
jgi:hypothetical protein